VRLRANAGLIAVALLTAVSLVFIWPHEPDRFLPSAIPWPEGRGLTIGGFERQEMRLGLDLQGGTRLLLRASVPDDFDGDLDNALDSTITVLRRRVDGAGVAEAEITRQGDQDISVQLPGLTTDEARNLLGRTALLRFCQPATVTQGAGAPCDSTGQFVEAFGEVNGRPTALTGRFLRANAFVSTDTLGNPLVGFEWRGDGPELSAQVTERLLGQALGIFLDDESLSIATVQAVIRDRGSITNLPLDRARDLVVQLNAGALPLELSVLQEQNVDATLGDDSVRRSVLAGEIGLLLVVLFMILYYRVPGVLAAIALGVYTVLTLAVFKLIPVTLTLAGLGAFVLSVGMAVDANILIFERMKEELRAGRAYSQSIDAGFRRAWPSIRDSNVTTLITCGILFSLGGGVDLPGIGSFNAPLVQGFAVTLAVGVLVSMFSAIVVSRALLRLLVGTPFARRYDLIFADAHPTLRAAGGSAAHRDAGPAGGPEAGA
jgi:preprotein translocase subunit SecD